MSKHSRERAEQRYNLELSKADERAILGYINASQCIPLSARSTKENTAICYVKYRKIPMRIVYMLDSRNRAFQIITVLPFDVEEYNQAMQETFDRDIANNIKFLQSQGYIVYKRKNRARRDIK